MPYPYHAFDFMKGDKKMRITVQYDARFIKRMGYEGLTKQEIDKKEKERLQGLKKTSSSTKKK
jgi:hypothetical protein